MENNYYQPSLFQMRFRYEPIFRAISGPTVGDIEWRAVITAFIQSDVSVPTQDEEKLLTAVEESQNKLLELKNLLLSKKSQVAAAKAELDQKTQSVQEINK